MGSELPVNYFLIEGSSLYCLVVNAMLGVKLWSFAPCISGKDNAK